MSEITVAEQRQEILKEVLTELILKSQANYMGAAQGMLIAIQTVQNMIVVGAG